MILPHRPRRNRGADWSRRLMRETRLAPDDLIWPVFVTSGRGAREPIASMPGVHRIGVDQVGGAVREARDLGIPAVALFPHTPDGLKTVDGAEIANPDNLMARAIREAKDAAPEIGLVVDVALDPYTDHGHCGILRGGRIVNDETVERLVEGALNFARAGADAMGPSDMMDGRVGALRAALDEAGHADRLVVSYAVKYASAFYGPFRDAVGTSGSLKGDKRTYQMDPANAREARLEARLDADEGADMLMVKPGLAYLDVLADIAARSERPVLSYQVSGEYAMIEAAAANGWIDGDAVMMESLTAFKRAGASAVITYFAPRVARMLNG